MLLRKPLSVGIRLACLDDPELWRAMGIPREALAELPTETVSTGLPDIILPMRDLCDGVPDIRVGGPSAIVAKGSLEKPVN